MTPRLSAPNNLFAKERDCAVFLCWEAVEGADGYKLFYYEAEAPDKCIKVRYAEECAKTVAGFRNGVKYLAAVCAYKKRNGREFMGELSEKLPFVPISSALKAQGAVCLKVGESAQLQWELLNSVPNATFKSDNINVARVDKNGNVTALSDGVTYITISAENQQFRTKIAVNRIIRRGENKTTLMFTGDIMCTAKQQRDAEKLRYDFHSCFSGVRDTLRQADYAVGVLETMCHDGAPYESELLRHEDGSANCNSPSSLLTALAETGFDGLVTATNHNCDAGREGLKRTAAEIKRLGMDNIGTMGDNPVIREINGMKIGFIGCCSAMSGLEDIHFPRMSMLIGTYKRDYFVELINGALRMGAEFIIAYQHWGSANSPDVKKFQQEEAKFMAEAGADLIIGSHPSIIQSLEFITTDSGKSVPVAYSLGNFHTTMSERKENRDSVILRVDLRRDSEQRITASLSYIPCYNEVRSFGTSTELAYPPYSAAAASSAERTAKALGTGISVFGEKPTVLLSGSPILDKIFAGTERYRIDRTGVLLSPLAMFGNHDYTITERDSKALNMELNKRFSEYIAENTPDFMAVDFYTAAAVGCYKLGDNYFTATKPFMRSDFFRAHREEMTLIEPPYEKELWQEYVLKYAQLLLSCVPHDRIVMIRQRFSDRRADCYYTLKTAASRNALNKRMEEMEDYFIRLVRPAVIDLSKTYIIVGRKLSAFEADYFTDVYRAFGKLTCHDGRRCVHKPDTGLWFNRVMKYYESMTDKDLQGWLLDMSNAADTVIAYSSKSFAAEHASRLIKLKQCGHSDLLALREFFKEDSGAEELVQAAEIIYAVQNKNLTGPYEFYELAFKRKFNILRQMASLLSMELNAPVSESNVEAVFLMRGKPQLSRYTTALKSSSADVWGSALSRMAVDNADGVHIGRYIFRQPQVLAFEPPVKVKLPEDITRYCTDNRRKLTVFEVFNRSGLSSISGSSAKWLIVDFFDLLCALAEYNGSLFRLDNYITRTEFYKSISDKCTPCTLFQKLDMNYCYENLTRFAEAVSKRYGNNIILIRTEPKRQYLSSDGAALPMEEDKLFDLRRKFLGLCEERFISLTGCRVIDIARRFYAAEDTASGSADTIRYEEEFYRLAGRYISDIISGSQRKVFNRVSDEYIMLRDFKIKLYNK